MATEAPDNPFYSLMRVCGDAVLELIGVESPAECIAKVVVLKEKNLYPDIMAFPISHDREDLERVVIEFQGYSYKWLKYSMENGFSSNPMNKRKPKYFTGCLVGSAIGDALGAPVEFMSLAEILGHFGSDGVTDYQLAYGRRGAITDDTQMTLFTAEGLVLSRVRSVGLPAMTITEFVYQAYLRWLSTQGEVDKSQLVRQYGSCGMLDGVLTMRPELHSRRAPGNTCLSALMTGRMGKIEAPINNSKGCGGVMRISPVGLFLEVERVFDAACDIAALTHGHPTGYLAAGSLAHMIGRIISGDNLEDAIEETVAVLARREHHGEILASIRKAMEAWRNMPVSFETVETLGQGWIAEEALAIGIYCALASDGDFEKGILLSVNHGGDSDSTGAITGAILGALLGINAIPARHLERLELIDLIKEIANDLFERA